MDFNDTPEEAAFRAEARKFLEANCALKGAEDERLSRQLSAKASWTKRDSSCATSRTVTIAPA